MSRASRSSSLRRDAAGQAVTRTEQHTPPPPLRDQDFADYYGSEAIPLNTYSSPPRDLANEQRFHGRSAYSDSNLANTATTLPPPPRGDSYNLRTVSPTSSKTYAANSDQPYGFGSLDLGTRDGDDAEKLATSTSRTPLHPGASVAMSPQTSVDALREKFKSDKGGHRSPRAHSRERSQGAGLGQWAGPGAARGMSPYGPLANAPYISSQGNGSGYNSAAASNPNLVFSQSDSNLPLSASNPFSRFVKRVFNSSFIIRWIIYILPILALLWIPGVCGLTFAKNARVWGVPLVWWSAWLSVVWCGWWGASLVARLGPALLRNTIGVVAPELRHYILYISGIKFYIGAAAWGLVNWVSFQPMVRQRATDNDSKSTLQLITQGLFGIWIVLLLLLIEKLIIQIVAHNFHKRSYEDRILEQKFQIRTLVKLYMNSRDIGRSDTLDGVVRPGMKKQTSDPALLVKGALHKAKKVAQSATTVIGTVASEIAGERVLQPTSPESLVTSSLSSANKTKQLARRIYFSFCPSYRKELLLADITRCFSTREEADAAFAIFDRDSNGDISLEELEMSCLEIHRERVALSDSMRDIDSAVGRLDSILQGIWYIVSIIIIVGLLDASFNTFIAGAGTLVLGLSWLIGTTAQEILASIIFLFIKHPYDVGDRVDIDSVSYVVKEMALLSTVFRRVDGTIVQAPHVLLNTKFVNNIRRSGAIQETFTWDVDFATSFEKIEELRERMLGFLENERRDFIPQLDISIQNFEGQGKLTLSADIRYKSNWQNGALKAQRRNKWCCALKLAMASLEIFGPAGAGNPTPDPPDPVPYTLVPYEQVIKDDEAKARQDKEKKAETRQTDVEHSASQYKLESQGAVVADEASESALSKPSGARSTVTQRAGRQ